MWKAIFICLVSNCVINWYNDWLPVRATHAKPHLIVLLWLTVSYCVNVIQIQVSQSAPTGIHSQDDWWMDGLTEKVKKYRHVDKYTNPTLCGSEYSLHLFLEAYPLPKWPFIAFLFYFYFFILAGKCYWDHLSILQLNMGQWRAYRGGNGLERDEEEGWGFF